MSTLEMAPARQAPVEQPGAPRDGAILAVLILAPLMIVLDVTVVNIALPSAQKTLDFSTANRQWVVTGYSLSFRQPAAGRKAVGLFGRRNTLLVGLVVSPSPQRSAAPPTGSRYWSSRALLRVPSARCWHRRSWRC